MQVSFQKPPKQNITITLLLYISSSDPDRKICIQSYAEKIQGLKYHGIYEVILKENYKEISMTSAPP